MILFDLQTKVAERLAVKVEGFREVRAARGFQVMQNAMGIAGGNAIKGGLGLKSPACLISLIQINDFKPRFDGLHAASVRLGAFILADGPDREEIVTDLATKVLFAVPFEQWGLDDVKVPYDMRGGALNVGSLNTLGIAGWLITWMQDVVGGTPRALESYPIGEEGVTLQMDDPEIVHTDLLEPPSYPIPDWKTE